MLPKRNDKKTVVNLGIDQEQDDVLNNPAQSEGGKMASFVGALDRRLKQQSEFLSDLFTKFFKTMKDELKEFGKSLIFLSSKYDEIAKSESEMRESLDYMSTENKRLCERVSMLESMVAACESGMENVKQYIRRDVLELHGIPVTWDENPNEIVNGVVHLLDRGYQFHDQDISISHRLPAPEGKISPIIAKFIRRNTHDHIFNLKRQLQGKSTLDLGFPTENRIYLNESLTQRTRELLKEVKAFKRDNHFKFVWTKQGKVFLKKDDGSSSTVRSFSSLEELAAFKEASSRGNTN